MEGKVGKGTGALDTVPVTVDIDPSKADVGDLAKAAAAAETPHRAKGAPSATLVLPARGVKKTDQAKIRAALKRVKGVDAQASMVGNNQILVKLDDGGGAKLADIKKALAGITKG